MKKITKFLIFFAYMLISLQSIVAMHQEQPTTPPRAAIEQPAKPRKKTIRPITPQPVPFPKFFSANYVSPLCATALGFTLGIGSTLAPQFSYSDNLLPLSNNYIVKKLTTLAPWLSLIFGLGTHEIALETQANDKESKSTREIMGLKLLSAAFLVTGSYILGRKLMFAGLEKINLSPFINIMSKYNS